MTGSHEPDFLALRPLLGSRIEALHHAWITGGHAERHEIEVVLELLQRQATNDRSILLQSPVGDEADGPIRLGRIAHGKRELGWLGLAEVEMMQHMAVTGRSGSGKSTLCLRVLLQLLERRIPWLVFDYKRSARALRGLDIAADVSVLAFGRDIGATPSFNILVPPPGVPVDTHQRQLVELIADNWYAGDGVIALLERAMTQAYAEQGSGYPTIMDIKRLLEGMQVKSREVLWKTSAQRILQQMTTGQLGRILCRRADADVLTLLRTHWTVIELDGLATNDANFLVQFIMRSLTQSLLAESTREQLRFVCLVEEAHHLLAKHEGGREGILENCLREGREIGLGIMLADQCISAISPTALANCFTSVCLNVRQRADVQAAAGTLLLSSEQRQLLSVLPVGEAVSRLSDRWPHPVHIRIPPFPLPKGRITDTDVQQAFLGGPFCAAATPPGDSAVPSDPASNTGLPPRAEAFSACPPSEETSPSTDSSRGIKHQPDITPPGSAIEVDGNPVDDDGDLQLLLRSVAAAPLLGVAARFDELGLSRRKGNALKKILIEHGYLRPIELPIPSGKTVLLELTDAARLWLQRHRVNVAPLNGSLPHAWYQDRVGQALRKAGWTVKSEHAMGGHCFDLAAELEGRMALIEVETSRSDWLGNLGFLERARADEKAMVWLAPGSLLRAKAALPPGVTLLQPRDIERWADQLAKSTKTHG